MLLHARMPQAGCHGVHSHFHNGWEYDDFDVTKHRDFVRWSWLILSGWEAISLFLLVLEAQMMPWLLLLRQRCLPD